MDECDGYGYFVKMRMRDFKTNTAVPWRHDNGEPPATIIHESYEEAYQSAQNFLAKWGRPNEECNFKIYKFTAMQVL